MAGGNGNITGADNTNGFQKNPQNINKKGRPASIKNKLKEILLANGQLKIPAKDIISIEEDGSVILKVPTQMQIALRLKQLAMGKATSTTIKAIQMIMEQIDGKPKQTVGFEMGEILPIITRRISDKDN